MQEWQAISVIKEEHINKTLETSASIDLNYYWIEIHIRHNVHKHKQQANWTIQKMSSKCKTPFFEVIKQW